MSTQAIARDTQWPDFEHTKLKWVQEHAEELGTKYPNQWVCIVDGAVTAAGTCDEAHDEAQKHDWRRSVVMLVDTEGYIYHEAG